MKQLSIQLENVNKFYFEKKNLSLKEILLLRNIDNIEKKVKALSDINLNLVSGKIYGLIGKNGAGKSTLLKIISGVENITEGKIVANECKIFPLLEQGNFFEGDLTLKENIIYSLYFQNINNKNQINKILNKIKKFSEINYKLFDIKTKDLNKNDYVKIIFALSIYSGANVLIIDEIFNLVDIAFKRKFFRFLKSFKKNRIIICVSHDLATHIELSDEILWMENGEIKKNQNKTENLDNYFCSSIGAHWIKRITLSDKNGDEKMYFQSDEDIIIGFDCDKKFYSRNENDYEYFINISLLAENFHITSFEKKISIKELLNKNLSFKIKKFILSQRKYVLTCKIYNNNHIIENELKTEFEVFHVNRSDLNTYDHLGSIISPKVFNYDN